MTKQTEARQKKKKKKTKTKRQNSESLPRSAAGGAKSVWRISRLRSPAIAFSASRLVYEATALETPELHSQLSDSDSDSVSVLVVVSVFKSQSYRR